MPRDIRTLAEHLNKSVKSRFGAPHRKAALPAEISLEPKTLAIRTTNNSKPLILQGLTSTLRKTEIEFLVPFVRFGEHYLAGHGEQRLKLIIELPNGTVRLTVVSHSYEQITGHQLTNQYLIKAQIVQISEADQTRYDDFIRLGDKASNETRTEQTIKTTDAPKKNPIISMRSLW